MTIFFVFSLYALWSSVFPLGKLALTYAPPLFLTGFRMLLGGLIITAFLMLRRKKGSFNLTGKQILSITLLAFFSIYLTNICEFWSLQYLPAAKVCFLYSLSPFLAAFFSFIHFGERMTGKKWIGMTIGLLGILPVIDFSEMAQLSQVGFADLAAIGAALFSVYGWVLMRLVINKQEVSPETTNGLMMLIGGGMALVHSFFIDSWTPVPFAMQNLTPLLGVVGIMTLVANVICYNLYGYMLRRFTATFLSFAGLLSPIFASLTSWALLGETPSPLILFSTAVILSGLWLIYQSELQQGYIVRGKSEESSTPQGIE